MIHDGLRGRPLHADYALSAHSAPGFVPRAAKGADHIIVANGAGSFFVFGGFHLAFALIWYRYALRYDRWAGAVMARAGFRRQNVRRPQWYCRIVTVGGTVFLAFFGALALMMGVARLI